MGAGATGAGLGIMGGILGGIGDITQWKGYKKPKFPKAGDEEQAHRKRANELLREGRQNAEGGSSQFGMLLPILFDALGIEGDAVDRTPELAAAQKDLNDAEQARFRVKEINQQLEKTGKQKIKGADRKALMAERLSLRDLKNRRPELERRLGELKAAPKQYTNLRKKAPTAEEQANQGIQDQLTERIKTALSGDLGSPALQKELKRQEDQLREQLQRDLGNGYELSSPGIRALSDFNERRAAVVDNANRADIEQLRQLQLGGAESLQNMTGNKQKLLSMIPNDQMDIATTLANLAGASTGAANSYQFDRSGQWNEAQMPNKKQVQGQMMGQSGDRWASIGSSMSGGK
jgi:hypothetical protein